MSSDSAHVEKVEAVTGYAHPGYAESLAEFGNPRELPRCGGWILQRQIPGFSDLDGMGCYPLFACRNWSWLYDDLEDIENVLVSLALVADPFGEYSIGYLQRCFDKVTLFKEHFVIDLRRPISGVVSKHHRRGVQKALRNVHVERCQHPARFIDEWWHLYASLIDRRNIKGIAVFSRTSFVKQLEVPGIVVFRAVQEGVTVGMIIWYIQGDVGYYHLGAYTNIGYELRASFALFWFAIEYFAAKGLQWLDLGAGAGMESNGTDGLTRFKRGWSTGTQSAYFCARVFDHERYRKLVEAKGVSATDYFPAYRRGEFN